MRIDAFNPVDALGAVRYAHRADFKRRLRSADDPDAGRGLGPRANPKRGRVHSSRDAIARQETASGARKRYPTKTDAQLIPPEKAAERIGIGGLGGPRQVSAAELNRIWHDYVDAGVYATQRGQASPRHGGPYTYLAVQVNDTSTPYVAAYAGVTEEPAKTTAKSGEDSTSYMDGEVKHTGISAVEVAQRAVWGDERYDAMTALERAEEWKKVTGDYTKKARREALRGEADRIEAEIGTMIENYLGVDCVNFAEDAGRVLRKVIVSFDRDHSGDGFKKLKVQTVRASSTSDSE